MSDQLGANFTAKRPRELFEDRLFVVPDYQRGYSWGNQQWQEFVDDIDLLPPNREHYTGTVVLQPSIGAAFYDIKGKPLRVFEVVDGQQRLTTLVLLADAIRRKLVEFGQTDFADGIRETFLFATDRNRQPHPKLRLGKDTHEFFAEHILQDKPWLEGNRVRSHRNLEEGKIFFRDFLTEKAKQLGPEFPDWLVDFRHRLSEQLILTVYPVGRESDAGVIFEVMNNRGKPITELEKVKNYLLYLASKLHLPDDDHQLGRHVNDSWAYIFQRLMSSNLATPESEDQLLRVHWLMAYDPLEKNWKGSKSLKAEFNLKDFERRHDELLDKLTIYVTSLRQACTAFCDVFQPRHPDAFKEYGKDPMSQKRLVAEAERLPRLRIVAPFLPLLVAVRLRFAGDADAYREVVERCERYAFRVYRLLQRRSQTGRSSLFLKANEVYRGDKDLPSLLRQLDGLTEFYSRTADFERAWEMEKGKSWYSWAGLRYFLYEYESYLSAQQGRGVKASWAEIEKAALDHTIEHVLPQTPKDAYWKERFDADALERCTHDIGNLCLTLDNSSYSNKPFPDKRGTAAQSTRCYAKGDLLMERALAVFEDWTEAAVIQRRAEIVAWAKDRWAVSTAG